MIRMSHIVYCPDGFVGYVIETSRTHAKVYDHPQGTNYGTTNRGRHMQHTAKAFRLDTLVKVEKGEYVAKVLGDLTRYTLTDAAQVRLDCESRDRAARLAYDGGES